jgi:hypothetical protein
VTPPPAGATGTTAGTPPVTTAPPVTGAPPAGTPPAAGTTGTPPTAGVTPGRTGGTTGTPGTPPTTGRATDPAGTTPAPGRAGTAADEPASFGTVKLFTFNGRRAEEQDVTVNFGGGQIAIVPKNGGAPVASLPYRRVLHATYIRDDNPRWDPALPGPDGKVDLSGAFNRNRHWLMLQTKESYTLLRLDGDAWLTVLQTFEARTGIKIDRPSK